MNVARFPSTDAATLAVEENFAALRGSTWAIFSLNAVLDKGLQSQSI